MSTGSSSSRARVQVEDLLNDVYIPVPDKKIQSEISKSTYEAMKTIWNQSQYFLQVYERNQQILGSSISKDDFRGI